MHNYQRTYPIKYNSVNTTNPIITSTNTSNYTNPQGRIYIIAGTAGAHFFPLYGEAPYVVTQFLAHGFVDVTITNNGKTLSGKFYADDGSVKDEFMINKSKNILLTHLLLTHAGDNRAKWLGIPTRKRP